MAENRRFICLLPSAFYPLSAAFPLYSIKSH